MGCWISSRRDVRGTRPPFGGLSIEPESAPPPGLIEATNNTTTFPGFTGHFMSRRRDAVATGTVVVDGETLVDSSTTNAEIETLEDTNLRTSG